MRPPTRIVEILRDFFEVHRLVGLLAERHYGGALRFQELESLIRDDEGSVLFRLKERSHTIFRDRDPRGRGTSHREALFDLAVGSLFHEAMKLRESLYQLEVYGPRVRRLRSQAGEESKALFDEFEKVLAGVGPRLEEGVRELEALVQRSADQLRLLLVETVDDGAARFLAEQPERVPDVFGVTLGELLEQIYGSVALGFERAGRAYLASGSFAAAAECLERALAEGANPALQGAFDYARGMRAYLAREYRESVGLLSEWARADTPDPAWVGLARDAVASAAQLASGDEEVTREATRLLEQLGGAPPRS